MIEIKTLKPITLKMLESFGFNGFMTDCVYHVVRTNEKDNVNFTLEVQELENTYIKEWRSSQEGVDGFNETIKEGHSFGAYEAENLAGLLIATTVDWNKSLWVDNIRVSTDYKRKNIGKSLMERLEAYGKEKCYRLIGFEVMASNYPAIMFYKKLGYTIDGLDLSHYPTRVGGQKEVAIFMKKYLQVLV